MNRLAIETLSSVGVVVSCIVGGIMALAIFFKLLNRISTGGAAPESLAVRGVLKKDTLATVELTGGEKFERVRFLGFTNSDAVKSHLPYDLNGMLILEDERGKRILVRSKAVRKIEIEPGKE